MPNIASVLREEIARLARKELRSGTEALKKSNAQYRRDIAELKRQVSELTRQVGFLERQEAKRVQVPAAESLAEGKRFSAKGLQKHRARLGVSADDYGRLVGVTGQTIYNWENGRSRPRETQLASLVEVRGMGKREAQQRLKLLEP